eukprot:scaffold22132_cov119-Isochrysis_galbana.AAC.6
MGGERIDSFQQWDRVRWHRLEQGDQPRQSEIHQQLTGERRVARAEHSSRGRENARCGCRDCRLGSARDGRCEEVEEGPCLPWGRAARSSQGDSVGVGGGGERRCSRLGCQCWEPLKEVVVGIRGEPIRQLQL